MVVLPWLVWILATLFQMVRSSDPAKENAEGDTEPLPGHLTNTFRYLVFNAGLEGIEPPLTGLEAVVLPLDHRPMARREGVEPSLRVLETPAQSR